MTIIWIVIHGHSCKKTTKQLVHFFNSLYDYEDNIEKFIDGEHAPRLHDRFGAMREVGKENEYYQAKLNQWINQGLSGVKEVKVLGREDFFINAYNQNYKVLIKGAKLNEMLATIPKYIVETVSICGMLVAIVIKIAFGHDEDIAAFIPQLSAFAVASFTTNLCSFGNRI